MGTAMIASVSIVTMYAKAMSVSPRTLQYFRK